MVLLAEETCHIVTGNIDIWYVTIVTIVTSVTIIVTISMLPHNAGTRCLAGPADWRARLKGPLCDKSVISDRRETSLD